MDTYGERMRGEAIPKKWKSTVEENGDQLIFASSDNGDRLAFRLRDLKRGEPDIFHLAPRSWQWRAIGKGVLGVVERIAERNLVFDRGPLSPYFLRARQRRLQTLTLTTNALPAPRAMDRWIESVALDGIVRLLDGDERIADDTGWTRRVLLVADTLVTVQAVKLPKACTWTLTLNAPMGKLPPAARELLDSGADLGWTTTTMAAAIKAARAKTIAA
jgi:hypothetical protein